MIYENFVFDTLTRRQEKEEERRLYEDIGDENSNAIFCNTIDKLKNDLISLEKSRNDDTR